MIIQGRNIKTVAVDFDGTLFVEEYPNIGKPIWDTINYVKSLQDEGIELILNTNREGKILEDAIQACKDVGIEFVAVNENVQWRVDLWGPSRKVGADLYIDDKAYNPNDNPLTRMVSRVDPKYIKAYEKNTYFKQCMDKLKDGVEMIEVLRQLCEDLDTLMNREIARTLQEVGFCGESSIVS